MATDTISVENLRAFAAACDLPPLTAWQERLWQGHLPTAADVTPPWPTPGRNPDGHWTWARNDPESGYLTRDLWEVARDDSLPPGFTRLGESPPVLEMKALAYSAFIPQVLLDDYAPFDFAGLLDRACRGDVVFKPHEPEWHRCFACWLVAKLTHHTRCQHGYLESGCWDCHD